MEVNDRNGVKKEEPAWQQEVEQYQQELRQNNIIVLPPEELSSIKNDEANEGNLVIFSIKQGKKSVILNHL